jgi:hypothetical protein
MSGKLSIKTPLRPEQRAYLEAQRELLRGLPHSDDVAQALEELDPERVSAEDVEEDDFHLSREYRNRSTA